MLVQERSNRDGYLSDEKHVNPRYVAVARRTITGPNCYRHEIETVSGKLHDIDERGYQRIVAWMEAHE